MRALRAILRGFSGLFLLLYGLTHAAFPLRGFGVFDPSISGWLLRACWMAAIILFSAAGVGVWRARPWERFWPVTAVLGTFASGAAFALTGAEGWVWGILFNTVVGVTALFAANVPVMKHLHGFAAFERRTARVVGSLIATLWVLYVGVTAVSRPWRQTWGTRPSEIAMPLPGDPVPRDPKVEVTHAITIDAPPEAVWPWLNQIGQDRGGFYSYSFLENLFGLDVHNAKTVHPEWQYRGPGELVRAAPPGYLFGLGRGMGWRIIGWQENRALVLEGWGAFVLLPQPDGTTRLIVRSKMSDRHSPIWACALEFAVLDLPHFIMEQQMLQTIKQRAEQSWRAGAKSMAKSPAGAY